MFDELVSYTSESFPLDEDRAIISPFWADADTTGDGGVVWYEESHNASNLMRASNEIKQAFPTYVSNDFVVTNLLIVTWHNVGYYNQRNDKVFTITVLYITRLIKKIKI